MIRQVVIFILLAIVGCSQYAPMPDRKTTTTLQMNATTEHPMVDLDHWAKLFPIETFQKTSGPRQFDSTPEGSPLDLWKPQGAIITSPAHLCEIELVRKQYARSRDLGRAVPVDIFLWSVDPPVKPFLTKLGGTPHREAAKPWPSKDGKPYTFVGQFCFLDSRDIVSPKLPGDVMLVFFGSAESLYDRDSVHIEWSSINLDSPLTQDQCPAPSFVVPRLSGHIYRTNEYPESGDVFEQAGHYQSYLFPTTQSTKIGRETFYTQNDPRGPNDELFCALNSVHPNSYPPDAKWPFIGLETLPEDWRKPNDHYEWGKFRMMFGDVGCMYFLIDKDGMISWTWDSY